MACSDPKDLLAELSRLEQGRFGVTGPSHNQSGSRRRHRRFAVRGYAELSETDRSFSNEPPVTVMLRDVGRGGLGFVTDRQIDVGSLRRIRFVQRGYCVGEADVVTRHCSEVTEHAYAIGCQICLGNGLMYLLGIDPETVGDGDGPDASVDSGEFLPPTDVE